MSRRRALVIGNGDYDYVTKLKGPRKDAFDMAVLFQKLGFNDGRVQALPDLDQGSLRDAIDDFTGTLQPGDLVAFYYSGHGVQGGQGRNYLVPTDAKLYEPEDLDLRCYPVADVIEKIAARQGTGLIFLDACRDDPFLDQPDELRTRSVGTFRKGLARVERKALPNILISYAAAPGQVAKDGNETRNSHYTAALLTHLPTAGLSIVDTLTRVTNQVVAATDQGQQPWIEGSLNIERFMLIPDAPGDAPVPPKPMVDPDPDTARPLPPVKLPEQPKVDPLPDVPPGGGKKDGKAGIGLWFAGVPVVVVALFFAFRPAIPVDPPACDTSTPVGAIVCTISDLDHPDAPTVRTYAAGRIEQALAGTKFTLSEKARIVEALLTMAQPGSLRGLSADGRFNVLARLADVSRALWLDPGLIASLETAHQTIAAIDAADAADAAEETAQQRRAAESDEAADTTNEVRRLLDSQTADFLNLWKANAGYVPRKSITVYPHYAGLTRDVFQTAMDAVAVRWGWTFEPIDEVRLRPGISQVRYGSDDMQASALLLAAQINGQVARPLARDGTATRLTLDRQAAATDLPKANAVKVSTIPRRNLEIWISK